ncbi:MAG: hypothetical protein M1838_001494 [Thelocarpon superellum]|nr:MAG: hypothetical protein M1838_001494 [Thelocarpon superellum]
MSSGFVSAGTSDDPVKTNDDWEKAKQEIEANRRRREDEARQGGEKSLFETLQANKAAKQEAFEESIRLKNQFRSLDEDEVDFLDSVLESTRAKEEAVKKETTEQLDVFRRQQDEADKALLLSDDRAGVGGEGSPEQMPEQWVTKGRKRKKGAETEPLKGVKIRRPSASRDKSPVSEPAKEEQRPKSERPGPTADAASPARPAPALSSTAPKATGGLLGLDYASDDDDD